MQPTIYTRAEYFRQLAADIAGVAAGGRVLVASMDFEPQRPLVSEVLAALEAAAHREVRVTLLIDAYTFLASPDKRPGPLWFGTPLDGRLREPFASQYAALERIRRAGGQAIITNRPAHRFSFIPGGRSHIKTAVINDMFYIGGCNLTDPEHLDAMTRFQNGTAADWLYGQMQAVVENGSTKTVFKDIDRRFTIDGSSQLIVDSGARRQSAILDQAYALIDDAQERLELTCQFFPGGATARHLRAARKRGVQVRVHYSPPSQHGIAAPIHHIYNNLYTLNMPAELFTGRLPADKPLLHAKLLVSEKAAMIGSHNYVTQGVNFGTAELACYSTDPAIRSAVQAHIERLIG